MTAAGRWDGEPDLIGTARSVNCLQQQIEVKSTLHLDDGQPLWLSIPYSYCITAIQLAFHAEPGGLQELLYRWVQ
jgi:hypothetical protein